jgi:hypothetical protein
MARTANTESQCLYKGALYLYVYFHFRNQPEEQTWLQAEVRVRLWRQDIAPIILNLCAEWIN